MRPTPGAGTVDNIDSIMTKIKANELVNRKVESLMDSDKYFCNISPVFLMESVVL
jgi:hypothetical protein